MYINKEEKEKLFLMLPKEHEIMVFLQIMSLQFLVNGSLLIIVNYKIISLPTHHRVIKYKNIL